MKKVKLVNMHISSDDIINKSTEELLSIFISSMGDKADKVGKLVKDGHIVPIHLKMSALVPDEVDID